MCGEEKRTMKSIDRIEIRILDFVLGIAGVLLTAAILWGANKLTTLGETVTNVGADVKIISREVKDHIDKADSFHERIPEGFFTQPRWGLADELKAQNLLNQHMALLDKKIALQNERLAASENEAEIWVEIIKGLVKMHDNGKVHK